MREAMPTLVRTFETEFGWRLHGSEFFRKIFVRSAGLRLFIKQTEAWNRRREGFEPIKPCQWLRSAMITRAADQSETCLEILPTLTAQLTAIGVSFQNPVANPTLRKPMLKLRKASYPHRARDRSPQSVRRG
jgi:hypothetical protein